MKGKIRTIFIFLTIVFFFKFISLFCVKKLCKFTIISIYSVLIILASISNMFIDYRVEIFSSANAKAIDLTIETLFFVSLYNFYDPSISCNCQETFILLYLIPFKYLLNVEVRLTYVYWKHWHYI